MVERTEDNCIIVTKRVKIPIEKVQSVRAIADGRSIIQTDRGATFVTEDCDEIMAAIEGR